MRRKWRLLQSLRIMRVYFRTPDGCSGWPRGSKVGWRNSECYGQPDAPRETQRIDVLWSHPGGFRKLDARPRLIELKEQLSPTYPRRLHMMRKAKAVCRGAGRAGSENLSTDSGELAEAPYSRNSPRIRRTRRSGDATQRASRCGRLPGPSMYLRFHG